MIHDRDKATSASTSPACRMSCWYDSGGSLVSSMADESLELDTSLLVPGELLSQTPDPDWRGLKYRHRDAMWCSPPSASGLAGIVKVWRCVFTLQLRLRYHYLFTGQQRASSGSRLELLASPRPQQPRHSDAAAYQLRIHQCESR